MCLWEGVVAIVLSGARLFSISSYTLGIADAITTVSRRDFEANLSGPVAIGASIVVTVVSVWYAGQRLKRFEIGETS